jgi:hypothetical protein
MQIAENIELDPICQEDGAPIVNVRHITPARLRQLGVARLVYLRQGTVNGETAYAIHAADGSQVAIVEDVDVAVELVAEHGLIFATVH